MFLFRFSNKILHVKGGGGVRRRVLLESHAIVFFGSGLDVVALVLEGNARDETHPQVLLLKNTKIVLFTSRGYESQKSKHTQTEGPSV